MVRAKEKSRDAVQLTLSFRFSQYLIYYSENKLKISTEELPTLVHP
jgi:hypothetical protein